VSFPPEGSRTDSIQSIAEHLQRGGRQQRLLPPVQDLPLVGEVPEERAARQARPLRDLSDRGAVVPVLDDSSSAARSSRSGAFGSHHPLTPG